MYYDREGLSQGCISCLALILIVVIVVACLIVFSGTIIATVIFFYSHVVAPTLGLPPVRVH